MKESAELKAVKIFSKKKNAGISLLNANLDFYLLCFRL